MEKENRCARQWRHPVKVLVVAVVSILICTAQARAEMGNARDQVVERIADSLLSGIAASQSAASNGGGDQLVASLAYLKRVYALARKPKPRIAVWPFRQNDIPVSKDIADELNAAVLAKLIAKSKGRYEFIARESLGAIISDMEETGALTTTGKNPIAALMESAQDISVLIEGKLILKNRKVSVSYKAVRVDGTIVAATSPENIRFTRDERNTDRASLSLNQALTAAVKDLAGQAHDMQELRLDGIRFETTGLQPDLGRYVMEKISAGLQSAFANVLTGRSLRVQDARINLKEMSATRGLGVGAKKLLSSASAKSGTYLLSGTYWDFGDSLELRISLTGSGGKTFSWMGRIRTDTVSGLRIHPENQFASQRENDNRGPIGFTLTTDRGDDPSYHIGEKLNIAIRLSRDAWVYCFYRQADGSTIQIFPNPHFWTMYSEPKLEGKRVNIIPGETTFPFGLTFQPPVGEELLKCFATSKNVTGVLPGSLRGMSLAPLPKTVNRKLSHIFRSIPNASVSEASVVITVVK